MIYCRIYNKTLEIEDKGTKKWFYEIWRESGWKNAIVWNIEFEFKRDFFKTFNIESVNDMFSHMSSIWNCCTKEHLVLTNNDKSGIENSSINSIWIEIANSFDNYISKPLIKRENQLIADAESLIPATIGNITTVAARLGVNKIENALVLIQKKGESYLDKKDSTYESKINEKISLLYSKK